MSLAFLMRILAALLLEMTPQGDYGVYLSVANKIANGENVKSLYYGVFPHALNFPIFLAFIFDMFGKSTVHIKMINILLGIIETGLVMLILDKIAGKRPSIMAGIFFAFYPSSIIFSLLNGGELFYDFLIVLSLYFYSKTNNKNCNSTLWFIIIGIIIGVANFFRPMGIIFVIAILLEIVINHSRTFLQKVITITCFVIPFVIIVFLSSSLTTSISKYPPPSFSFGWNLYVGMNVDHFGRWNKEDGQTFIDVTGKHQNPSDVQSYFTKESINRLKNFNVRLVPLFLAKTGFWFDESFTYDAAIHWRNHRSKINLKDGWIIYLVLFFLYNAMIVFMAIKGIYISLAKKKNSYILRLISVYLLGTNIMFMFLEVSPRYRVAYEGVVVIMAAIGLESILISRNVKSNNQNDSV